MLTYDMRNHGMSGFGSGGICTVGLTEYRDVIGSLRYAASRLDTNSMKKALLSVCMGANSTAVAWAKHPSEFAEIQALILLQPLDGRSIGEQFSNLMGFEGGYDRLDRAVHERTGLHLEEQSPLTYAHAITVPTLVAQVHDDVMTRPEDVQAIYDAIPIEDKKLDWVERTTRRFDGYNYFSNHPEVAVSWFDDHVH